MPRRFGLPPDVDGFPAPEARTRPRAAVAFGVDLALRAGAFGGRFLRPNRTAAIRSDRVSIAISMIGKDRPIDAPHASAVAADARMGRLPRVPQPIA